MLSNNFTTLLTIDNNLSFQQNFKNYPCQVVVLVAPDNTYDTVVAFLPAIIKKIKENFTGPQVVIHPSHSSYNSNI